jgi:hypothetical protein
MGDLNTDDVLVRVLRSGVGQDVTIHMTHQPTGLTAEATGPNTRALAESVLAILTRRLEGGPA